MNAFQLQGPEGVRQGDFYSLMFFVVALANLVVYAAVGWVSNIIAQVVIRVYRLEMFDNALRQDMDFFDREENATGALASRLSTYPTNLQELLGFNVMLILINVVNVLSSSVLALIVGWKLGYGGRLISTGEYSTSQFFIVFIGVIFSGEAAAAFFSYTTSITKAQSAANHILWFRTLIPSIREDQSQSPPGEKDSDSGRGPAHVECEDLEFSYASRPNTKVLQGVNIDVKAGAFAALVGPSGCGKSTMIALLERFYDPTSGCIRFDGTDIKDLCPRRYRRNVALVQQEPVLYQGSIRDNVAMGLATEAEGAVSDEKVEEACKQANIYEFVSSLPDGFSTLCGSRGTQLSGGQRQRVAIARALIRAPRLLLLDEATSALDTESEKVVQAALEKAQSGRTTVAVAHRLSTVKDADVIMVFSKGRIVESGTHVQLLAKRGVYYEMCLGQSLDRDPV
ncbi:hypothetical protein H2199_002687 [Coniosporium tulheliwenetii]|uniref:Uncharacterized protein n=1 Tax=Coniosporium tulheliwenetii TaxID=3383036 RepID=A0ACC2ZG76_9PEZI|nr:hypothetical protein H2199_002687 [Cladosporium sp. JES 115]